MHVKERYPLHCADEGELRHHTEASDKQKVSATRDAELQIRRNGGRYFQMRSVKFCVYRK